VLCFFFKFSNSYISFCICSSASGCKCGNYKMLSYRRETALQGALQFSPKVEDWNSETIFYGHDRSIFNHCDIIGRKICRIPWKKRKIRARSFKVIEVGTNRKPVC